MTALSITPFTFEDHLVRTVVINDEPWFFAVDVYSALDIQNPSKALKILDSNERSNFKLGRQGDANIISESGMFTLVLRCRYAVKQDTLPHRFRKWVTSEVLPSIRKTSKYEHRVYKPESHELFTANDASNLARLIWHMSHNFRFKQAWSNGIWYTL